MWMKPEQNLNAASELLAWLGKANCSKPHVWMKNWRGTARRNNKGGYWQVKGECKKQLEDGRGKQDKGYCYEGGIES